MTKNKPRVKGKGVDLEVDKSVVCACFQGLPSGEEGGVWSGGLCQA